MAQKQRRKRRRRVGHPLQRRRRVPPQRKRRWQQRRGRRRSQGSVMAYLVSMVGSLAASNSSLGWGGSLAAGAYTSNSSDGQLRSVGNGLLTGAGLAFAFAVWRDRERLLEAASDFLKLS